MKTPNTKELEKTASKWNAKHPIGTAVKHFKLINPLRLGNDTQTRSDAWVMGGHSVMVMVAGVSGGVPVESLQALN